MRKNVTEIGEDGTHRRLLASRLPQNELVAPLGGRKGEGCTRRRLAALA